MKPESISTFDRAKTFQEIPATTYDVLIIGGGIMGAGIALDAASRNLKVLLVEKQDFAAGTSSRSTKLIHGGLRYLKNLEFRLVQSVASERQILHRNAPHLVIPEPMLIPVLEKTSYGYWATKIGLTIYDWLGKVAAPERHRMLNKAKTLLQEPLLNPKGLKGAGFFIEYRTDDGRLTMEVLKTASAFGATCLNYTELSAFNYSNSNQINGGIIIDQLTGSKVEVKAKCVINATGPWSGKLMQQDKPANGPVIFHTKGVHLVLPFSRLPLHQSVYFDIPGGRMIFAIPRNKITYVGTTDTPFTGNLENPEVTLEDVKYILDKINEMFPDASLQPEEVVSSWAGVRALLFESGKKPSEISRKDEIFISETGLITIAGGKLTGYRHLAEKVIDKVLTLNFPKIKQNSKTRSIPLSGGKFKDQADIKRFDNMCYELAKDQGISTDKAQYLVRTYGSHAETILNKAAELKTGNSNQSTFLLEAEIWYTITNEGATNISDFLIRRTGKLYFERQEIEQLLPETIGIFRKLLNWDEQTTQKNLAEFKELYQAAVSFKQ